MFGYIFIIGNYYKLKKSTHDSGATCEWKNVTTLSRTKMNEGIARDFPPSLYLLIYSKNMLLLPPWVFNKISRHFFGKESYSFNLSIIPLSLCLKFLATQTLKGCRLLILTRSKKVTPLCFLQLLKLKKAKWSRFFDWGNIDWNMTFF